ncbi:hypothetical protein GCM10027440_30990 [Nocardiopsis coralliicola]
MNRSSLSGGGGRTTESGRTSPDPDPPWGRTGRPRALGDPRVPLEPSAFTHLHKSHDPTARHPMPLRPRCTPHAGAEQHHPGHDDSYDDSQRSEIDHARAA